MSSGFSFSEWYAQNGEAWNERRKHRYANDPVYRQRVIETNRATRARQRAKTATKRRERMLNGSGRDKPETVEREVNGRHANLYRIKAVAKMLGCSVQSLRAWEREGRIPKAIRSVGVRGERLYSSELIASIKQVLAKEGRLGAKRRSVGARSATYRVRFPDGKVRKLELFSISALAEAMKRHIGTVENLEYRGALPPTPFRIGRGRRLYTEPMIAAVKAAMVRHVNRVIEGQRGDDEWKRFRQDVAEKWGELGIQGVKVEGIEGEEPNGK